MNDPSEKKPPIPVLDDAVLVPSATEPDTGAEPDLAAVAERMAEEALESLRGPLRTILEEALREQLEASSKRSTRNAEDTPQAIDD